MTQNDMNTRVTKSTEPDERRSLAHLIFLSYSAKSMKAITPFLFLATLAVSGCANDTTVKPAEDS